MIAYFAYGTTQRGFPHHRELELGEPEGRFRTVQAHGIVVPRDPACSNPGCRYAHRMAALVPGQWSLHPEGDVFMVDDAKLARLDALELAGPYVRGTVAVVPTGGGEPIEAQAYPAREPLRWAELVWAGLADAVEVYTPQEETPKACCAREPGHAPPHDVLDPLDPARLADKRLRNVVLGFVKSGGSLHILEATAATTPWPNELAPRVHAAIINWRHSGAGVPELQAELARELDQTSPS